MPSGVSYQRWLQTACRSSRTDEALDQRGRRQSIRPVCRRPGGRSYNPTAIPTKHPAGLASSASSGLWRSLASIL